VIPRVRRGLSRRAVIGGLGAASLGAILSAYPPVSRALPLIGSMQATDGSSSLPTRLASSLGAAVDYLKRQRNPADVSTGDPAVGLLREAPIAAPNRYWLMNDNAVAVRALEAVCENALASSLLDRLDDYGCLDASGRPNSGLLELLWDVPIVDWPPKPYTYTRVAGEPLGQFDVGPGSLCYDPRTPPCDFEVCVERWDGDDRFRDWDQYANLAAFGALNEHLLGNDAAARPIIQTQLDSFVQNGVGFPDLTYRNQVEYQKEHPEAVPEYETFKLAVVLYVATRLGEIDRSTGDALAEALLAKQHSGDPTSQAGGFHTHYTASEVRGDTNTETTSFAILAMHEYLSWRQTDRPCRAYLPIILR
jgi:hypothetical protein